MNKHIITQYKGRLTAKQAVLGINAAIINSQRLVDAAKIMFDANSYPIASSLAILSIEESGKVSIIRHLTVVTDDKELKETWKEYRNHRAKNANWILLDLVKAGARKLKHFKEAVNKDGNHTKILDIVKQLGFYTDFYEEGHCSVPIEVIDKPLVEELIQTAEILCKAREVTEREIELWIEHMSSVWQTSDMSQALVRWSKAMQQEGLLDNAEKMSEFVSEYIQTD